jgi:hypothetical protein
MMAKPIEIFDMTDTGDLPDMLQPKKQGWARRNSRCEQIFRAAGRPLTNSEFRVAYYRRFGVAMAHNVVGAYLSTNAKRGMIVRLAHGLYALPEHAPSPRVLLFGWIGAAMVGGALDWRPLAWLTGDRGTGEPIKIVGKRGRAA